jgi:PAS domain S-box-containing protein
MPTRVASLEQRLRHLFDLSLQMQPSLTPREIMSLLLTEITHQLGFERAVIFLLDKEHNCLRAEMSAHASGAPDAERLDSLVIYLSDGGGLVGRAALRHEPYIVTDVEGNPKVNPALIRALDGLTAFAAVPMIARDELIGIITVDNPASSGPIDKADLELLILLANQAAARIANARLIEAQKEQLDQLRKGRRLIEATKRNLQTILDSVLEAAFVLDTDGAVSYCSASARRYLTVAPPEIIGRPIGAVLPPSIAEQVETAVAQVTQTGRPLALDKLKYVNGSHPDTFLEVVVKGVTDEEGSIVGSVLVFRDLSVKRKTEQEVRESEQASHLAKVASAMAHEFRNPLNSLGLNLEMLSEDLGNLPGKAVKELSAMVEVIRRQVDRLTEINETYRQFARLPYLDLREADLAKVALDFSIFTHHEAKMRGVRVTLNVPPEPLKFRFDEKAIWEVLLNLVKNAYEAMPTGGDLAISVCRRDHWACLSVKDTGHGIPEKDRGHIFDELFTSKPGGSGLGLAIARQAVRQHGGEVFVESEVGKGATFTIQLPMGKRR